jgi:hypothetical protein
VIPSTVATFLGAAGAPSAAFAPDTINPPARMQLAGNK